ncbi:L-dopachrome tautomerase yellow-f2-like [Phlebotomus argentipes]|uniref:L-dopachrome tautomerase yellow-f2-like n=1 Tax=Phlebotomus argentipes TaxID=94469 RepID=UPI0028929F06|nr:L-dopachrome tautomerase yellow-f2-like [Phlebotomus argentipes]
MFATIGRLREGIPSTLNAFCTSDYRNGSSPHLWGFPNYEVNTLTDSDYDEQGDYRHKQSSQPAYTEEILRFISVYHPTVDDKCDRVFLLDTGVIRTTDDKRFHVQKPSIIVFGLPSNGCASRNFPLIQKIEIPDELYNDPLGIVYLHLDFQPKGGCDDLMIYITNTFDHSIIVFDYAKNDFWLFANHSSLVPVPGEDQIGDYVIEYGILSATLGWPDKKGNRIFYYAPGASTAGYAVTTKTLKNRRKSSAHYYGSEFRIVGYLGCAGNNHRLFFDPTCGVMFFGQMNSGAVKCWNVAKPYNPSNIATVFQSQDDELFTDVFVDSEGYLWMHSSKVHKILASQEPLDLHQVNSATYKVKVQDAIRGTVCENDGYPDDEITWQYLVE